LDALKEALTETLSGRGRLVMLAGEPGIGKTRTAQQLAAQAAASGGQVLWGRCFEEEGVPPYWPWFQLLRSYVQGQDPDQLRSHLGPVAAGVAEMLPELRVRLPELEQPPALEPEQARFRLFDSTTTFLRNASRAHLLMLVLDDLHWADQPSLLLLRFLARQMEESRLLVVGTYRDVEVSRQHPLVATLAQLSREPVFQHLSLRGLSRPDTQRFIEVLTGAKPAAGLVEGVYAHTEGNPFFTAQVIGLLREDGELTADMAGDPVRGRIPQGVREVIGQRLNRLSHQCRQVLVTAAIIGREFQLRQLSRLHPDDSEERLLSSMDEALEAHLIEELPGSAEGFQFSHALFREALASELSAARRVRLHARVGEALEQLYAADLASHASQLAHHFAQASPVLGPEKLIRYSGLAGQQALATYAWEEALAHFERGLAARRSNLMDTAPARDADEAELLFGLAKAQSASLVTDQLVDAFNTLRRAFDYYAEAGEVALAVETAEFPIGIPTARFRGGDGQVIARALSLVRAGSHEAGRLLSRYGGYLGLGESDYEGAQHALGQAISIARRERDVPLEVQTLAYAANVSGQHLHWQESVDIALRAIELATGKETTFTQVLTRFWAAVSLLHMGDPNAARPHVSALREMAERRGNPRYMVNLSFVPIITVSCLEGKWSAAREHSDRSIEVSPLHPQLLALRVLLEYETGHSIQGKVYLERLLDQRKSLRRSYNYSSGRLSMVIAEVDRITKSRDHWELAVSEADAILSAQAIIPVASMYARAGLALLAAQQGDQSAAGEHYDYFLRQPGNMIWTLVSADRLLGLLARTLGGLEQAAAHFEDALGFCRNAGYRPELAWSLCDYSDTLVARGRPGDRTRARDILEESLAISDELGMGPLMARVAARLEGGAAGAPPPPAHPDGLTQREMEVLVLIARGRSNPEIARELVVSIRTVTTHVSNIFNKINAANRAEAATYAIRHGLM
jgi:DNA-binding CsgD family transcriptional regulator/tetratricopeptide (TPR) repeat protein